MIAENVRGNLTDIYFIVRGVSGWLSHCKEAGYADDELDYLEELDNEFGAYQPVMSANRWAHDVMQGGGPDVHFADTADEKLGILAQQIMAGWLDVKSAFGSGTAFPLVHRMIISVKEKEKLRDQISLKNVKKHETGDQVSEWEIEKAREYPLENIIGDKLKHGRMPCPFHNGKDNNFSVKNGIGRCFVCGVSCDSIKYLMEIDRMSFLDAVRYLNRR